MSLTYEILKRAVKLTGMKKRMEMSAAEIIAVKKKENRRNAIPDLQDDEMDITVTSVSGFPLYPEAKDGWNLMIRLLKEA